MNFITTDKLELADKYDCDIWVQKTKIGGVIDRKTITLRSQNGKHLMFEQPMGLNGPVELQPEELEYWKAANFIEQVGPEDTEGLIKYRLTADGHSFAKTGKAA